MHNILEDFSDIILALITNSMIITILFFVFFQIVQ